MNTQRTQPLTQTTLIQTDEQNDTALGLDGISHVQSVNASMETNSNNTLACLANKGSDEQGNLPAALYSGFIKFAKNEKLSRNEALAMQGYFDRIIQSLRCDELNYSDCLALIKKNSILLKQIPVTLLDYQLCLEACKLSSRLYIYEIPKQFRDEKMWQAACYADSYILPDIPKEYITQQLVEQINYIDSNGLALIPEALRSDKVFLTACKSSDHNMASIPSTHPRYEEFFDVVIAHSPSSKLKYVHEQKRTLSICTKACANNARNLEFVPAQFKTFEMCKVALGARHEAKKAIRYFPENLSHNELSQLYRQACLQKSSLYFVPDEYKTKELCEIACSFGASALFHVPDELITEELRQLAKNAKNERENSYGPTVQEYFTLPTNFSCRTFKDATFKKNKYGLYSIY